ncbi:Sad1 / UNC-like C-terminal, putative [Leishmania lindenbergi]|uniref:Sad1 / UNC-like C-terminal n=1 Tax=Leishmania lindenbergi TaxID=651832 RepID=A0AAW3A773_9TRYP
MRPEERLTVLCALLLLYALFSVPLEFLTVFRHRTTPAAVGISSPSPLKTFSTGSAPGLSINYASSYLGATVVSVEPPSCHGGSALISDSAENYVLCPCNAARKQFVMQLIRDVEVRSVMVRNAEHFSSGVRNFTLLGSLQYPTSAWLVLGHFEAEQRRGRQYFDVTPGRRVRFIKLQWATSYGPEPWCTITSFQVYGIDLLETLTRFDESDDLVATEGAAEVSGGHRCSPDMDCFHRPALPSTPGKVVTPSAAGSSAVASGSGATPAVSIDELAAEMWNGATATARASKEDDTDVLLFAPVDVAVSADGGSPSHPGARAKRPSSTSSIALVKIARELQSPSCSSVNSMYWNASLQCTFSDLTALWGPCAVTRCGTSSHVTAVGTTPTHASASSVSTASIKGFPASRSIYQSVAASLLTQLLRQQRSLHHELTLLTRRQRHLAEELNHTRGLLSNFYAKYKETEREFSQYRNQLRGLQAELQLLQERFLLRRHSSFCGEGVDTSGSGGSIMRSDTTLTVILLVVLALMVVLVLIYSSSSSFPAVSRPSDWERYYSVSRGGGSGSPPWLQPQRGRAK